LALAVALLPTAEAKLQAQASQEGQAPGWRKCPFCAEVVREAARVCRYCQRELPPKVAADPRPRDREIAGSYHGWIACPQCGRLIRPDPAEMTCYLCRYDLSTEGGPSGPASTGC
jgi:hypothetical protein